DGRRRGGDGLAAAEVLEEHRGPGGVGVELPQAAVDVPDVDEGGQAARRVGQEDTGDGVGGDVRRGRSDQRVVEVRGEAGGAAAPDVRGGDDVAGDDVQGVEALAFRGHL